MIAGTRDANSWILGGYVSIALEFLCQPSPLTVGKAMEGLVTFRATRPSVCGEEPLTALRDPAATLPMTSAAVTRRAAAAHAVPALDVTSSAAGLQRPPEGMNGSGRWNGLRLGTSILRTASAPAWRRLACLRGPATSVICASLYCASLISPIGSAIVILLQIVNTARAKPC